MRGRKIADCFWDVNDEASVTYDSSYNNTFGSNYIPPLMFDDPVDHPSHYTDGKIEVIQFMEDKKLPYHLGNVIKYICRAGKKDKNKELEDLEKAQWYLNRYLEIRKDELGTPTVEKL